MPGLALTEVGSIGGLLMMQGAKRKYGKARIV